MGLITRLKSLLGLGDERSQTRQRDSGVTIEREPTETREQVDATNEKAVKKTESEESPESKTSVSTEDLVDEGEPTDHIEEAEAEAESESGTDTAAEPAEAVGPSAEAGQPVQTEGTEPEPGPEEIEEAEITDAKSADSESAADTEPADESETTDVDSEAGRPLEDVKGIGPAYAERLRNVGVDDAAQLAVADSEELANETDLSTKRIEGWIERAKSM